jgi:dTDP-4-amino-4,6-dideoxygalactose transaminase
VIPYGRHDVDDTDIATVESVLRGDWLTTGPAIVEFEDAISAVAGDVPAVSVSSGTAALHVAYAAAGICPGDEVITPPLTFVATQATAALLGADIVFADVRPDSGCLDPEAAEAAITPRTKAITAVDYAGHPADMDALRVLCDEYGLLLIEDAAHSLGTVFRDRPVGTLADLTTLSFYPTKNITTGEGGAVLTAEPSLLDAARKFARQGLIREPERFAITTEGPWHQEVHHFGLNYRLPDVLAALGTSQLARLPEFKARRAAIKARYDEALADLDGVTLPHCEPDVDPVWHLYPLRVPADRRTETFVRLREAGIGVQVNYVPAYWHPVFEAASYPRGLCPVAEEYYAREISLPMHTRLTEDDVESVIAAVRACLA